MARVVRASGITASEQYLARLADRTFLNLWAYPNVFRDVVVNGRRAGKEICDLLVVCGDHVIIFSDKTIQWPDCDDIDLSWSRWYNRAIAKSVAQIRGAERWIAEHPDRLFLDAACTQPLPLRLPPTDRRIVSGIVVALGADEACRRFYRGGIGSFVVRPEMKGLVHAKKDEAGYQPFAIGDVDPAGSFIHVLNDVTLDIVMRELDTVTDLTAYLERKAAFIRSGSLMFAAGEEELLAYYLTHMVGEDHGFTHPENREWSESDKVAFEEGFFAEMLKNPSYQRKKHADEVSYTWDRLIETFTQAMIDGTSIVPEGQEFDLQHVEVAVRQMAQEPRTQRRLLANGLLGVIRAAQGRPRTFRAMLPSPENPGDGVGYAFMTVAVPGVLRDGGYEQYRKVRVSMMEAYCFKLLQANPYLRSVVCIATEPPAGPDGPRGSSEDLVMIDQPAEWTPEFSAKVEEAAAHFDIMRGDRLQQRGFSTNEYPELREMSSDAFKFGGKLNPPKSEESAPVRMRARSLRLGRNSPCPCGSGKKYKKCCLV